MARSGVIPRGLPVPVACAPTLRVARRLVLPLLVLGGALLPHSSANLGQFQCKLDPLEVLSKNASCFVSTITARSAIDCYNQSKKTAFPGYFTYYTFRGICFMFSAGKADGCNAGDFRPPNPLWDTVVFGSNVLPCNIDVVTIYGDPHFVGADGTRYDFNGAPGSTYCLVTDKELHVNALLSGYNTHSVGGPLVPTGGKGVRTWMRELGFIWRDLSSQQHALRLVARSGKLVRGENSFMATAELDGRQLAIPTTPGVIVESGLVKLAFVGNSTSNMLARETYQLSIPARVAMTLQLQPPSPAYQLPNEAFVHFNIMINKLETSPAIHGILGQTFRTTISQRLKAAKFRHFSKLLREHIKADGSSGFGFLDGMTADYVATSVLDPDCARSSYVK